MENVFEPMNFAGDVFEPLNFDGDYSNFAVLNCGCNVKHPFNKGKRTECINKCNQKKADKKGDSNVTDISSLTPTPTPTPAPTSAPPIAPVTNNDSTSAQSNPDGTPKSEKFLGMPKKVGIGVVVGVGVLAVGLTTFFLLRKK